jgi:uncharacterized protein YqgC (DUF456 family)
VGVSQVVTHHTTRARSTYRHLFSIVVGVAFILWCLGAILTYASGPRAGSSFSSILGSLVGGLLGFVIVVPLVAALIAGLVYLAAKRASTKGPS